MGGPGRHPSGRERHELDTGNDSEHSRLDLLTQNPSQAARASGIRNSIVSPHVKADLTTGTRQGKVDGMNEMQTQADRLLTDLEISKDLRTAVNLQTDIRATIDVIVRQLRNEGETWQGIGERLNITRQAAQQRFGHLD